MSQLLSPLPSFLFISNLYCGDFDCDELENSLNQTYGPFSVFEHEYFPMAEYYSKEMGQGLLRKLYFFNQLFERSEIVEAKKKSVEWENQNLKEKQRQVNLDPGIITLENMQLATGKMYSHRIYLRDGVYSDLQYQFKGGEFEPLPWCYPDYCHGDFLQHFKKVRKELHTQLKQSELL